MVPPHVQDSSNDDSQVQDQVGSSSAPSSSTQEPIVPQRIHHVLVKDHPVDQIMGDISNRVDEALRDPDWVNAMHEELNNFTRNQV